MSDVRVRFAPSPTGLLHIGNVRTALFNWLFARKHGGQFILRIEDTDKERSKQQFIEQILFDLKWLKLNWDEGFDKGGEFGPYLQSDRAGIYEKHLQELKEKGLIYPCFCTQEELDTRRKEDLSQGRMPRYDNRCRHLSEEQVRKNMDQGKEHVLRFKVPEKKIAFDDMIRGHVEFDPKTIGDFVLVKSDGGVAFHFAVTVDDALMNISHVIRGEDHLSNTPRHIMLFEALGKPLPKFAHLPMILGPDGSKLSKRNGLTSIDEHRKLGYLSESLVNYLSFLGWSPPDGKEILSLGDLIELFELEKVNKSASTFDIAKLNWVNSHHIRAMDDERLADFAQRYLKDSELIQGEIEQEDYEYLLGVLSAIKGNLQCLSEIPREAKIFFEDQLHWDQPEDLDILQERTNKELLLVLKKHLDNLQALEEGDFKPLIKSTQKETGKKGKGLYMPIRLALTGKTEGPELVHVMVLLGKQRCIERLNKAILL